jgi:hypothetical protein
MRPDYFPLDQQTQGQSFVTLSAYATGRLKRWLTLAIAGLPLWLAGCGGGSGPSPALLSTRQALVVGGADGVVFRTIQERFNTVPGSGDEDTAAYAMIIFDGNRTTPGRLQANPGVRRFLSAGKPVVILNGTGDHLHVGLSGVAWAHAHQLPAVSPAVALMLRRDRDGVPRQLVQVNFPVRMAAVVQGAPLPPRPHPPLRQYPLPLLDPTPSQLLSDSQQWLDLVEAGQAEDFGAISPASGGPGQTVLSFDDVTPATIQQGSVLNGQPAPDYTAWGEYGTQPPDFSTSLSATFETRLYATLTGNSPSSFQHQIIARQYLLVSPPSPLATSQVATQYAISGSNWSGSWPVFSTMGFNDAFTLGVQLTAPASNSLALGMTENMPESINGVTTLTTSQSHTETVGVSVTGGIESGDALGTLGASWSDSWSWGQSSTVSFQDWEIDSTVDIADNAAQYNFVAYGGSDITNAELGADLLQLPPNNYQIWTQLVAPFDYWPPSNAYPQLNQLQTSAMTNQSETAWTTSSGQLVAPQTLQFISSALIYSGEMLELTSGIRNIFKPFADSVFTGYGFSSLYQVIDLNFGASGIQPPGLQVSNLTQVAAPWTLSFGEFKQSPGLPYATVTGTVALTQPTPNPLTINLTYVIQPQQQMLTLPVSEACQGNTTSFNPGNSVIDNGAPPLSVTIPAGKTSVSFPLTFQTFNSDTYNVQVVAWLTQTTVNGQQVINPQSAWCLTPPNTIP